MVTRKKTLRLSSKSQTPVNPRSSQTSFKIVGFQLPSSKFSFSTINSLQDFDNKRKSHNSNERLGGYVGFRNSVIRGSIKEVEEESDDNEIDFDESKDPIAIYGSS